MKLVPPGGAPPIALWDHALDEPNLEDARIDHALAGLAKVAPRVEAAYRRAFRHKCWQYMTVDCDAMFLAFVIGTAGFAGNAFVYAFEKASGRVTKHFAITPLAMHVHLAPSSTAGTHRFTTKALSIQIENRGRDFDVAIRGPLEAQLAFTSAPADEHFALCVPLAGNRWNYTHKFGAFAVSGAVTIDGKRQLVDGLGSLDFTKMYALRHAVWRWIAVAGKTRSGRVIALNLVDPTPVAPVSENCAWIDGARIPLANARLSADRVLADGVDLRISPLATVEQKLSVPLVAHHLGHVIARFEGRVLDHPVEGFTGISESNDTYW